ncbi:MAG: hypothetical protein [Bacteriophage sp.]|nr:MAG: hypothetical protein [Bacteriophage sp.]
MPSLMKGETWKDALKPVRGKPRFDYPIWVEAKADEIRCHVQYHDLDQSVSFSSYAGKPLHNLGSFAERFRAFFASHPHITELDVGVEVNGNFNDSYRWTQSSSGIPQEKFDKKTGKTAPALDVDMVEFILFDLPGNVEPFYMRVNHIDAVSSRLLHFGISSSRPARYVCQDERMVVEAYRDFRDKGYEGAMGKTRDHLYERKRTFGWMKIKPSETFDGRITAINRATSITGDPLSRAGSISVELEDGSTADPAGIAHALGSDMFANPGDYIGRWVEFEAMERDRAGGYRHPRFIRVREDKQ